MEYYKKCDLYDRYSLSLNVLDSFFGDDMEEFISLISPVPNAILMFKIIRIVSKSKDVIEANIEQFEGFMGDLLMAERNLNIECILD